MFLKCKINSHNLMYELVLLLINAHQTYVNNIILTYNSETISMLRIF